MFYDSENRYNGADFSAFLNKADGTPLVAAHNAFTYADNAIVGLYEFPNPDSDVSNETGTDEVWKQRHELTISFPDATNAFKFWAVLRGLDDLADLASYSTADIRAVAKPLIDPVEVSYSPDKADTAIAMPAFESLTRFVFLDIMLGGGDQTAPDDTGGVWRWKDYSSFDEAKTPKPTV